ncbi:MAG: hypothetical protein LBR35_02435, partial [Rickettsiales bacterium]|nr:hypothetical protein [Rickettsiales bacterium]
MEKFYQVCLNLAIATPYDYRSEEDLQIGQVVLVPLRGKEEFGVVIGKEKPEIEISKIKKIKESYNYVLSKNQMDFLKWVSVYTMTPIGMIFNLSISEKEVFTKVKLEKLYQLKEAFVLIRENETRRKLINFLKGFKKNLSVAEMSMKTKIPQSVIKNLIKAGVLEEKEE